MSLYELLQHLEDQPGWSAVRSGQAVIVFGPASTAAFTGDPNDVGAIEDFYLALVRGGLPEHPDYPV